MQAKIAAGAQFVQTQFCMDAGVVRRYVARLAEHGLADKLSLLIGIAPLRSAKSARWIKEKLFGAIIPDALVERMEAASDPVGGRPPHLPRPRSPSWPASRMSPACHIMAPGNDAAVPDIITAAREEHLTSRAGLIAAPALVRH